MIDIETDMLLSYKKFIYERSIFKSILKVIPDTPRSFSKFPTIVFREINNADNMVAKTLNRQEYMDNLTYQIDIYTKSVIIDGIEYQAKTVINEIRKLTAEFFMNLNFSRTSDTIGDYLDIEVSRRIMLFSGKVNNWNMNII